MTLLEELRRIRDLKLRNSEGILIVSHEDYDLIEKYHNAKGLYVGNTVVCPPERSNEVIAKTSEVLIRVDQSGVLSQEYINSK
tara:strand:- start:16175 stop:16423 length:249 start_codon:yes stop_codon:yes gene_type:complete